MDRVHLTKAGRKDDLRRLLLNFNYLQAKPDATDTNALIADYDYLPEDKELQPLQSGIRLSAHVLARDPRQLAGQLIGRLLGNKTPSVQVLLKQAAERKVWPWLRPLKPSLTAPAGSLIRTLEGHTSRVNAVALTSDGRRAVSASDDRTLRLWDLESGKELATFTGDGGMGSCAIATDARTIVVGEGSGQVHFLRFVEADPTKLLPTEVKSSC